MTFDPAPESLARRWESDARLARVPALRYARQIGSTNDAALALAAAGAPEGTCVLAGAQRAGRGRLGHTWFSPEGAGIYLSLVTRPSAQVLTWATLAAGVAAAEAIAHVTGLTPDLKWPNDLMVGRPWRKLGGILAEASSPSGSVDAVIIGIGINVLGSAFPREFAARATALEVELGRQVDTDALVVALAGGILEAQRRLGDDGTSWVRESWRRFGHAGFGATVRWNESGVERRGVVRDVDADGALVVESGRDRCRLVAGEVFWERQP